MKDADYRSWPEVNEALQGAIRYKNARRMVMPKNREKGKRRKRAARKRVIWRFRTLNSAIETRH